MSPTSDRVLKFDYRGAPQTISVMRHAILSSQQDLSVRTLAEEICGGLRSKDYTSEYLALYQWVLGRCRYMRDPRTVELVRAPYIVCRDALAGKTPCLDCDDEACLLAALVLAVGGHAELVTVAFRSMVVIDELGQPQRQYSHVFCRAQDPRSKQWIVLDPVAAEKTGEMLGRTKFAKVWAIA